MPSLDVRPDHLEMVKRILAEYVPGRRVLAFGSRVTGKAKPTSDLGICIMDEPLDLLKLSDLRDAFSASNIPYKVDVLDWSRISPDFRAIIEARFEEL